MADRVLDARDARGGVWAFDVRVGEVDDVIRAEAREDFKQMDSMLPSSQPAKYIIPITHATTQAMVSTARLAMMILFNYLVCY